MKTSIPVMFIFALAYGSAAMADCGDESAASNAEENAAPTVTPMGGPDAAAPQAEILQKNQAQDRSAGASRSTAPAKYNFLYTPYEDEGYKP